MLHDVSFSFSQLFITGEVIVSKKIEKEVLVVNCPRGAGTTRSFAEMVLMGAFLTEHALSRWYHECPCAGYVEYPFQNTKSDVKKKAIKKLE